jgi:hypothetical protein
MSRIFGAVSQNGYVVRDIGAAMDHWVNVLGVGPWFYIDRVKTDYFRHRGVDFRRVHEHRARQFRRSADRAHPSNATMRRRCTRSFSTPAAKACNTCLIGPGIIRRSTTARSRSATGAATKGRSATRRATSPIALAWLFNRNPKMIAICGCDTLAFLAENLGALEIRSSEARIAQIGEMFAPGNVAGDRYGAALMRVLDK